MKILLVSFGMDFQSYHFVKSLSKYCEEIYYTGPENKCDFDTNISEKEYKKYYMPLGSIECNKFLEEADVMEAYVNINF